MRAVGKQAAARRHPVLWLFLALAALGILGSVLAVRDHSVLLRWSVFLSTDVGQGRAVFQRKGCIHCHSVNGEGGKIGPDLGEGDPASVAFLVTAMWNHAPDMWGYMRAEHFTYPALRYEQTAQLVGYLYMASRMDAQGDASHGRLLFSKDGCIRCHSVSGKPEARGAPFGGTEDLQTPLAWAQAMWDASATMEFVMRKRNERWPALAASDLNDLYAYVRANRGVDGSPPRFLGDPERGWQLFQSKGCIACHSLQGEGPQSPGSWRVLTFMQIGQSMWNSAPAMLQAMNQRKMPTPRLSGKDLADLAAFVYTLRYFDPVGSAIVGRSIFHWRGCSRCHGAEAQGTKIAPALRGEGRNYNSISLATALWSHGPKMFQRSQELGLGWPRLQPSDVGDLLAFLNTPRKQTQN